jgi:uncharacterized protein (DUF2147 family)
MQVSIRSALLRTLAVAGLASAAFWAIAQPAAAADPRGRWVTESGNLEVEIASCGAALCGTVTKVLGNRSMSSEGNAMQPVDGRSPLGMKLLDGFVPVNAADTERPTEWSGEIYNRENGKTYRCRMALGKGTDASGRLVLRAYVGIPLFGKTQHWQRATADAGAQTSN